MHPVERVVMLLLKFMEHTASCNFTLPLKRTAFMDAFFRLFGGTLFVTENPTLDYAPYILKEGE